MTNYVIWDKKLLVQFTLSIKLKPKINKIINGIIYLVNLTLKPSMFPHTTSLLAPDPLPPRSIPVPHNRWNWRIMVIRMPIKVSWYLLYNIMLVTVSITKTRLM